MPEENVEIVRRAYAEFADSRGVSLFAPDFVWDTRTFRGIPDPKEWHGRRAFIDFFEQWVDPFDEWEQRPERLLDTDESRVVAVVHQRGRPHGGDAWVEMRYGLVYTVQRGLIRRVQVYATPEEALEATGLSVS
jgi:ketosteroid isomerase-like protein